MTAINIRAVLISTKLDLPELAPLIGHRVELTIRDDTGGSWPEGWFEADEGAIEDSSFEHTPQPALASRLPLDPLRTFVLLVYAASLHRSSHDFGFFSRLTCQSAQSFARSCSMASREVRTPKEGARVEVFLAPSLSFPFDDAAAEKYAQIRRDLERAGQRIGAHDLEIAAIAVARQLTLVTHNVSEFSRVSGLVWEDWESVL
jgi:tRNA(fMet)-specific endonuclease VapC